MALSQSSRLSNDALSISPGGTPSPVSVKRKRTPRSARPIIETPNSANTISTPTCDLDVSQEEIHARKRRQSLPRAGTQISKTLSYDMKYHPMDEILRPNSRTTVKARERKLQLFREENSQNEDEKIGNKQNSTHASKQQSDICEHQSRNDRTRKMKSIYDMSHHPMDESVSRTPKPKQSIWLEAVLVPSLSEASASSFGSQIQKSYPLRRSDTRVVPLSINSEVNSKDIDFSRNKSNSRIADMDMKRSEHPASRCPTRNSDFTFESEKNNRKTGDINYKPDEVDDHFIKIPIESKKALTEVSSLKRLSGPKKVMTRKMFNEISVEKSVETGLNSDPRVDKEKLLGSESPPDTLKTPSKTRFGIPFLPPLKPGKRIFKPKPSKSNFQVHEDSPGRTPRIKWQLSLHPESPGTDVPKENLVNGARNRGRPVIISPSLRTARFQAVRISQERDSILEPALHSTPEGAKNLNYLTINVPRLTDETAREVSTPESSPARRLQRRTAADFM